MLEALSPQRRRLVVGVLALALALVLILAVAAAVRLAAPARTPVPPGTLGPVLLVPGYGGTGESLAPLAAALRAAGRTAVVVPAVGDGRGDLREQAERLDDVADDAMADSGAAGVDVVGFSAGGVVARLWARDEGGATKARRVLTLGSPHHGTTAAERGLELAGGCPAACRQLVPDSDLLRRLNAGDETPDGPVWVTLRTAGDEVVTPVDSAALDGAVNLTVQDLCPGAAARHGDLPGHPVTLATLGSVLGPGAPQAPPAPAC